MTVDYAAAVAEVLGKPVAFDLSEPAVKVRKTLIAISIAVLCIVVAKIEPGDSFTVFGLNLNGITPDKILWGGVIAISYSLFHFLIYVVEILAEYRVRLTGTFRAFSGERNGSADYPSDPRQSTLYGWWVGVAPRIANMDSLVSQVKTEFDEFKRIHGKPHPDYPDEFNYGAASGAVDSLTRDIRYLVEAMGDQKGLVLDRRVSVSLGRFDNWFKFLLNVQGARVLFIEVAFPVVLGFYALYVALDRLVLCS